MATERSEQRVRSAWRRVASLTVLASATVLSPLASASSGAADARVIVDHAVRTGHATTRAPKDTSFDVVLAPRHAAQLRAFIADLSNVSSPLYHHFLARGVFAREFAPSANTVAQLRTYFSGYGLTVHRGTDGTMVWRVSGATPRVAAALNAHIVGLKDSSGGTLSVLGSDGTLPASLASHVAGIEGLSSVDVAHSMVAHATATSHHVVARDNAGTNETTCNAATAAANDQGAYLPSQQSSLYGLSNQWASGVDAAGTTIGVYELAGYSTTSVTTYLNCFGLANQVQPVISVDGGPGRGDTSVNSESESDLDIEEVASLAPGATIEVYEAPNSTNGALDEYAQMAQDDTASIITTSWGQCESQQGASGQAAEATVFEQMAAQGQTIIAAAGDDGSTDCVNASNNPINTLAVDDPASQPDVLAVGGLAVTSISPLTQAVWNSAFPAAGVNDGANAGSQGGGGGGISSYWSRPSWQSGDNIPASRTHRLVPDISVMADPSYGFLEYTPSSRTSNAWSAVGGTSIGSPLVAALLATATQACGGGRLGLITPTLYAMARQGAGFDDVTQGNNNIFTDGGNYHAGVGYDLASGVGSPDASSFISTLCAQIPAAASIFSSTPVNVDAGSSTVTIAVTNDAAGPIAGVAAPSVTATQSGATVSVTPLSPVADAAGQVSYAVTTTSPGTVHLTFSFGGATLLTTQVAVGTSASATAVTNAVAALGVTTSSLRATAFDDATVFAGVTSGGKVVVDSTTSAPVTLSVTGASGAPALACNTTTCDLVVSVGGALDVVTNLLTRPVVTKWSTSTSLATGVTSSSLSVAVSSNGTLAASYLRSGHVITVTSSVSGAHPVASDLTVADHLGAVSGGTSLVSPTAGTFNVAVVSGGTLWLLSTTPGHKVNVSTASAYSVTANGALTSTPMAVIDQHVVEIIELTSTKKVVVFSGTTAAAATPSVAVVAATNASAVALTSGVNGDDLLVRTATGALRLIARTPSWTSFDASALTSTTFSNVTLIPGGTSGVVSMGVTLLDVLG